MTKEEVLERIQDVGMVAVIRLRDDSRLREVIEALGSAGAMVMEITMTVPGAIESISRYAGEFGDDFTIGCGTITDPGTATRAIEAGAEFVVSPVLQEEMVAAARSRGVVAIPAAFSATEVWRAHSLGADAVKLFPARSLGPAYLHDILGPLPQARLMPAGGVDVDNVASYIMAGAMAVFSGSSIVSDRGLREGGIQGVEDSARMMIEKISETRREMA